MSQEATVAIVGAGLVGALNAIYFAQRGWKVELFELRSGKTFFFSHELPKNNHTRFRYEKRC
jgi:folate-dependent tRNA-U54 methylase TrmFO/GidA